MNTQKLKNRKGRTSENLVGNPARFVAHEFLEIGVIVDRAGENMEKND